MKIRNLIICLSLITNISAYCGNEGGGGGDASEARVNEIRSDIALWILNGGAKALTFPPSLTYEEYVQSMTDILAPKKVIIGFVEKDHPSDEDLQVNVNGMPKTCRGFTSKKNQRMYILCNISRFEKTTDSNQYKLIHHEYAGLVGVERNDGAASDYELSSQITDFLTLQTVLRLAIKPHQLPRNISPDGMVAYNHAVHTGYGYYDVFGPLLRGTDGNYYPMEAFNERNVTNAFCQSLGLSRNYNHPSTYSYLAEGEKYVSGLFESPKMHKKKFFSKPQIKVTVINCENVHDPQRSYGSYRGPVIEVRGGTIVIPVRK